MKIDIREELVVPEKVIVKLDAKLMVKGPKVEVSREFRDPAVKLSIEQGNVVLTSSKATKREKTKLYTFVAHIKNMFKGVVEPHSYDMKICAAHFPMNVAVTGKDFIVKNFLGENAPRIVRVRDGVTVKVSGNVVHIESCSRELAGTTASEIELLTKIRNRDRRIFQDGIFITHRNGVALQ